MRRMTSIIFAILFVSCLSSLAQTAGSSIYLGVTMPRDGVSAGPLFGYKFQYDLPITGLGLIATADFTLNMLDKDSRNSAKTAFENWLNLNNYDDEESVVKQRNPVNFAIPLNVGVNYSYPFGRIRVWAESAIGFAPLFSSRQVWKADKYEYHSYDSDYSDKTITSSGNRHYYDIWKYKPALAFSYKIGIGAMLDNEWSLGLDVSGLSGYKQKSVHKEDCKRYYNSNSGAFVKETENKIKAEGSAYVALRIGYHF